MFSAFGKNPTGELLKKTERSANYKNDSFHNIEYTTVTVNVSMWKLMKDILTKPSYVKPAQKLPSQKTDLKKFYYNKPAIIWFGHSSYLINCNGFTVLVDPVFSGNASPFTLFVKAFKGADIYAVDDFPEIDILLLTHDHYDHLDHRTIKKINKKTKRVICSLGMSSHLIYWGIEKEKIIELDWWDETVINNDIKFTATPARHFSGRSLKRGKTLWSSFVLEIFGYRLFIGGDSGYDKQFEIIGKKFRGFDLALLETGQYNTDWPLIHMFPEQAVEAAADLNAKVLMPVHWGKFSLAYHAWNEPPKRVMAAAGKLQQKIVIPMIGQAYIIGETFDQKLWWDM